MPLANHDQAAFIDWFHKQRRIDPARTHLKLVDALFERLDKPGLTTIDAGRQWGTTELVWHWARWQIDHGQQVVIITHAIGNWSGSAVPTKQWRSTRSRGNDKQIMFVVDFALSARDLQSYGTTLEFQRWLTLLSFRNPVVNVELGTVGKFCEQLEANF